MNAWANERTVNEACMRECMSARRSERRNEWVRASSHRGDLSTVWPVWLKWVVGDCVVTDASLVTWDDFINSLVFLLEVGGG